MKFVKYVVASLIIVSMLAGCASTEPEAEAVAVPETEIVTETVDAVTSATAVPAPAPEGMGPAGMMFPEGFNPADMPIPEGFDPANMQMPEGFDPANMQMPEGFDPSMMGPAGGFSVAKSEPIEFTTDETSILYDISVRSVASPNVPVTYYDEADILNLEEYEIVSIILKGDSFSASALPADLSIEQDGEKIVIENKGSRKYNYYLEGRYEGTIVIESDDADYAVTFNDAEIKGKSLPAMQLKSETKAFFYSAEGSVNRIADSADNGKKGAVTSSGDIIINGKGEIEVTAYKKHGLKVDGTVRMVSGKLVLICDESSEGNAVSADDAYIQDSGDVFIYAYGNIQGEESKGIKVNGREGQEKSGHLVINGGTITIDSVGKALTAGFKAEDDGETETLDDDPIPNVYINNGVIKINTTGDVYEISDELSLSPEGIEAKNDLYINGGIVEICATDDALNSGNSIIINSGCLLAYSRSADSIDANYSVAINGGILVSLGSTNPEMAIDCDSNTRFKYTGGYVVALSGGGSQTPSSSETTGYALSTGSGFAAGETFAVVDSTGAVALAFTVPANYTRANGGILASDAIAKGETYTIVRGVTAEADFYFNGAYYGNVSVSGGEEGESATVESSVTPIGAAMGGMGAMGGFGGGGRMGGFDPAGMQMPEGFDPSQFARPEGMEWNRGEKQNRMWAPQSQAVPAN